MDQMVIVIDGQQMSVGELDEAARSLRRELLELPVHDVIDVPAGAAPAGARVIDAAGDGRRHCAGELIGGFAGLAGHRRTRLASQHHSGQHDPTPLR